MILIGDVPFRESPSVSFSPPSGVSNGFIKIHACGELAANSGDQKLLIRLNNSTSSYKSYVLMSGDANAGERETGGFYLGRNGWNLDATFSLEFTLAINPNSQKVVGSGNSVFALGDNRILGYESHGFFVTRDPISQIDIAFTGGVVKGQSRFYRID